MKTSTQILFLILFGLHEWVYLRNVMQTGIAIEIKFKYIHFCYHLQTNEVGINIAFWVLYYISNQESTLQTSRAWKEILKIASMCDLWHTFMLMPPIGCNMTELQLCHLAYNYRSAAQLPTFPIWRIVGCYNFSQNGVQDCNESDWIVPFVYGTKLSKGHI